MQYAGNGPPISQSDLWLVLLFKWSTFGCGKDRDIDGRLNDGLSKHNPALLKTFQSHFGGNMILTFTRQQTKRKVPALQPDNMITKTTRPPQGE